MLSRAAAPEEVQFERALRPRTFQEYVGQEQAVASLRVSVEAARQRSECVDHVLLYGPPGLGKTTLAGIIANEMGTNLVQTAGPAIERGAGLAASALLAPTVRTLLFQITPLDLRVYSAVAAGVGLVAAAAALAPARRAARIDPAVTLRS